MFVLTVWTQRRDEGSFSVRLRHPVNYAQQQEATVTDDRFADLRNRPGELLR